MDDVGLYLAEKSSSVAQATGRFLLKAMPWLLKALSLIGTVAMLWVGGGIILHGLHELGLYGPSDVAHSLEHAVEVATGGLGGLLGWATYAAISALVGLVVGFVIAQIVHRLPAMGGRSAH
jgi:predicted DNA repair protein MutK